MADTRTSRIAELDARVKEMKERVAVADGILIECLLDADRDPTSLCCSIALALLALRDSHD